MTCESAIQAVGLVRPTNPGAQGCRNNYQDYLRKFYYPQITNPAHLFTARYNWDFFKPMRKLSWDSDHPLRAFRPNTQLPALGTGILTFLHWERRPTASYSCYAVEPIFPGEVVMAEYGCARASILVDVAKRGCDNAVAQSIGLIDWNDGRTLCRLSSDNPGIAQPWVTLLDTAELEAHMAKAERLDWRPL